VLDGIFIPFNDIQYCWEVQNNMGRDTQKSIRWMDFGIINVLSNVCFLCVTVLCYFLKNGHVQAYVFDVGLLDFATPTDKTEDAPGFLTHKTWNVTIKALSRMEKLLALKFKSVMLQLPHVRGARARKGTTLTRWGNIWLMMMLFAFRSCCEGNSSSGCCLSDARFTYHTSMSEYFLPHRYAISA
jgi:hypothetical protein